MPSDKAAAIIIHLPSFALVLAFAIATLGVAAALVHDGFDDYPNGSYRPRIIVLLSAACWTTFTSLILMAWVVAKGMDFVGVIANFLCLFIGFSLFLGGAAALGALWTGNLCGDPGFNWGNCALARSLLGLSWTTFFFIIVAMIAVGFIAVMDKDEPRDEVAVANGPAPAIPPMAQTQTKQSV